MDMSSYEQAKARMISSPDLQRYADTILAYWPEEDEHWDWVATGPIEEVIAWAKKIEGEKAA